MIVASSTLSASGLFLRAQLAACSAIFFFCLDVILPGTETPARLASAAAVGSSMSFPLGGLSRNQFITPASSFFFLRSSITPRGKATPLMLHSACRVGSSTLCVLGLFLRSQFMVSCIADCFCLAVIEPAISGRPAMFRRVLIVVLSSSDALGLLLRSQSIASAAVFRNPLRLPPLIFGIPGILLNAASVGSSRSSTAGLFSRNHSNASSMEACFPSLSYFPIGIGTPLMFAIARIEESSSPSSDTSSD
mmetsp:Transcript_2369/g.4855  ORF Transcript_2369/g.4855 Transcript_2369/m.4855 type:complete len:249 (-) Transcript_2369:2807-3553(-)